STNLSGVTSDPIVVGPGTANRLVFTTQPGSASAGYPFGIQPVVKSQDQFGNISAVGLPASQNVTVTLSSGTGTLSGNTSLDIGTAAGNGTVAFTNLQLDSVGTNKQLTASASGMSNGVSVVFGISAGVFSKLQLLVPGETAAPGTASGKTGTPSSQAAGTPFNVTVNAVDANWNVVNTISDTIGLTSSDNGRVITVARGTGTGTLQGTLTATTVNGIATFANLSYNLAETITLNFTATGLTNVVSGNVVVSAGPFAKLQLLAPGESAAPGTTTGKTGTPSAQTANG